jgi:hypothetical protein
MTNPDHAETLRKTRALLERLRQQSAAREERQRILDKLAQPDPREAIARRIMQGLVILFVIYAAYGLLNCAIDHRCPAYPVFKVLLG